MSELNLARGKVYFLYSVPIAGMTVSWSQDVSLSDTKQQPTYDQPALSTTSIGLFLNG